MTFFAVGVVSTAVYAVYLLAMIGVSVWATVISRRPGIIACCWGAVASSVIGRLTLLSLSFLPEKVDPLTVYSVLAGLFSTTSWGLLLLAVLIASRTHRSQT